MSSNPEPLVASKIWRTFDSVGGDELEILRGVDLTVGRGEAVAIVGTSGAGKSTLLNLLGALDQPSSGDVSLGGVGISTLTGDELADVRNRSIGFIFQFHHLLREFSAVENVMMPCLVAGLSFDEARDRAERLLGQIGLRQRLEHKPSTLSGGEQQRVAVARAVANKPLVVLADEPTGNLDRKTSEEVHDLLFALREEYDVALVIVTHNRELAAMANRVLELSEGQLQDG